MFHKENTIDVQTDLSVSKPDDYMTFNPWHQGWQENTDDW